MRKTSVTIAVCAALLAAGRTQAVAEGGMPNTCQNAVGTAAATFVRGKETAISTCLNAVSAATIGKQGTDPSAAANTCVAQFRLLNDSRGIGKSLPEKLAAAIAKSCNPNAPLTRGDVLRSPSLLPQTRGDVAGSPSSLPQTQEIADQLGEWCAAFGGNGSIATLRDWTTCVNSAAECAVDTAISTLYPRVLEWLGAVELAMNDLTPPSGDPNQVSDALAALDAVKAAIDGPNNDNVPSPACGLGGHLLTCQTDLNSCATDLTSCSASLGTCNGNLSSCNTNCSTCNTNLATCNTSLSGTQTSLSTCNTTLTNTQSSLTTCNTNLTGCTSSNTTCSGNLSTCNTNYSTCNANLGICNANLSTTEAGLSSCNTTNAACTTNLNTCTSDYSTCTASLGTCTGDLSTCTGDLTTCNSNLATVNAGTAAAGDVLSGKTFSSGAGLGVTGTVPAGANVSGGNGLQTFAIPDGLYSGSKTATANDTNLAPGNIVKGVSILGVTGTQPPSQPLRTGQTSVYGTGSDADSLKGDVHSLTDNGDGTITDNKTGLMWEKKDQAASGIHNWNDTYTWGMTSSPYTMNGTMVTTFLATLNTPPCFAGHCDWRIPNVNELQGIANYQTFGPAVDAAFDTGCAASCTVLTCGCTRSNFYWSSTTDQGTPSYAWLVGFYDGYVVYDAKSGGYFARAVRGGS